MDHVQSLAMDSGRNGPVRAHRGDVIERGGPQVWQQPLLVSCWACFASGLSQDEVDMAMRTKDRDLQKVATRLGRSPGTLEECPDQFPLVVRDLLAQVKRLKQLAEQTGTPRSSIDTAA